MACCFFPLAMLYFRCRFAAIAFPQQCYPTPGNAHPTFPGNKEAHMAVIVLAENKALTREMYEMMLEKLRPVMKDAPGFVAHMGWSTPDGWRVCEIWRSQADANQFFAKFVHPNLPPDAKPHRTVFELHALVEK
jgi:hypothetical protein